MKKTFFGAALLTLAAAMLGCGEVDMIFVCYENHDLLCNEVEEWQDTDLVCNEAVSVAEQCSEILEGLPDWLPDWLPIPDVCRHIPDMGFLGTCQALGGEGAVCAEDADCLTGLSCQGLNPPDVVEGTCSAI